jgi:hypothetical protein
MTTDELKDILRQVWYRELSADEAWDLIDNDRERPQEYSRDYWLPLTRPDSRCEEVTP